MVIRLCHVSLWAVFLAYLWFWKALHILVQLQIVWGWLHVSVQKLLRGYSVSRAHQICNLKSIIGFITSWLGRQKSHWRKQSSKLQLLTGTRSKSHQRDIKRGEQTLRDQGAERCHYNTRAIWKGSLLWRDGFSLGRDPFILANQTLSICCSPNCMPCCWRGSMLTTCWGSGASLLYQSLKDRGFNQVYLLTTLSSEVSFHDGLS